MGSIDITKVDLKPKSVLMLCAALTVLFLAIGVGQWGAVKAKEMIKGASAGVADEVDAF